MSMMDTVLLVGTCDCVQMTDETITDVVRDFETFLAAYCLPPRVGLVPSA